MRKILERHDPILKQKAQPIADKDFNSHWLKDLVAEMIAIIQEKGAVGIAAPQIGVSKRVIVFGTGYTKRRKVEVPIPDTVLINPTLKFLSEEREYGDEGCLNGGGLVGTVPRAIEIEYSGFDVDGTFIKKQATGLEARILQHEIDHLDGILFFDRVEDQETVRPYEATEEAKAQ